MADKIGTDEYGEILIYWRKQSQNTENIRRLL